MAADPNVIICTACNRRYAYKPHLAGRTITCKCGAPITVAGKAGKAAKAAKSDLEDWGRPDDIMKMVWVVGAMAGIVTLVAMASKYGKTFFSSHQSVAPAVNLPGADGWVVDQINAGADQEAEQWIKASNEHAVVGLKWTHEVTQKFVDLWYSRNAKKVLAFGNSFWTSALAIELPDDKAQRKYFFDYADYFYGGLNIHRQGFPDQMDVGQKYLVIFFVNPNPPNPEALPPSDMTR